jgi:Protein of unknown function (DUF2505)
VTVRLAFAHELDCTPEGYWSRCVLDKEHNYHLFLEELKFARYTPGPTLERGPASNPGLVVERLILVEPNAPAGTPAAVRGALSYEEVGILDRAKATYSFTTRNCTWPDAVACSGAMHCRDLPRGRCLRETTVEVSVRVPMLGWLEGSVAKELRRSFDASARFANQWLRAHPVASGD